MVCLNYEPCSPNNLIEWWIAYRKSEQKLSLPSIREVHSFLLDFEEKGWVHNNRTHVQAHKEFIEFGCRSAFDDGVADAIMDVIRNKMPLPEGFQARYEIDRFVRELRFAIYKQDYKRANKLREKIEKLDPTWNGLPEEDILIEQFDADFFHQFSNDFKLSLLNNKIFHSWYFMMALKDEVLQYFIEHLDSFDGEQRVGVELAIIQGLLLKGRLNKDMVNLIAEKCGELHHLSRAIVAVSHGEYDQALEHYDAYARLVKDKTGVRIVLVPGVLGIYYPLLLLRQKNPGQREMALKMIRKGIRESYWFVDIYKMLNAWAVYLNGDLSQGKKKLVETAWNLEYKIEYLFYGLIAYWMGIPANPGLNYRLDVVYEDAKDHPWHRLQLSAFLPEFFPKYRKMYQTECKHLIQEISQVPLARMFERIEPWQQALQALIRMDTKSEKGAAQQRLVWLVDMQRRRIQPKLQKMNKSGRWSRGQNVALKRLMARELNCITPEDEKVIECIELTNDYYYGTQYVFDFDKAIIALVGHPHVYSAHNPTQPLELQLEKPHLVVDKKADHYILRFSHPVAHEGTLVFPDSETSFRIVPVESIHRKIAEMMDGKGRLRVPASAEDELRKAIGAVSRFVVVHSDIESMGEQFEQVESHPRIHCRIVPLGNGMKFSLFVRPFGDKGPYFRPGRGSARVIHDIDGRRVMAVRDLKEEKKRAMEVWAAAEVWIGENETIDSWVAG
ncbi:MAG: hypothetical protein Q9P14_15445 [candidate division KSB1 bacterium]|nr:hypothetical protein [candidate division KSB1 bacterium]